MSKLSEGILSKLSEGILSKNCTVDWCESVNACGVRGVRLRRGGRRHSRFRVSVTLLLLAGIVGPFASEAMAECTDIRVDPSADIRPCAEGDDAVANGDWARAKGFGALANGPESYAEGEGATANGGGVVAKGGGATANGAMSYAEGNGATVNGRSSKALGDGATANGRDSDAEGDGAT
ncbi:TPA: hypothetical protein QDA97_002516, partial [Burkholderia vietnamiensis]|nr:hypothetical protein [Burkholderia vietnamiensis]